MTYAPVIPLVGSRIEPQMKTGPAGNRTLTSDCEGVNVAVSKRTRFEVLRRDNYTCRYCRSMAGELTVDHVTPVALGGSDAPDNLVAACRDCNAGKSSSSADQSLVDQVTSDALRWASAIRLAAEKVAAQRAEEQAYCDAFVDMWGERCSYIQRDWRNTLIQLRIAGLPLSEVFDAADVALSARYVDDRWRYFCGVAWKKLAKLQATAAELLAEDAPAGPQGVDIFHLVCAVTDRLYLDEADRHDFDTWLRAERLVA